MKKGWMRLAFHKDSLVPPIYPSTDMPGIKLHIGSGEINIQGWINLDARAFPHTHIVSDKIDLSAFADYSISSVYLCHLLEHFSFGEVSQILQLIHKKLKPNGKILISVPDLSKLVDVFREFGDDVELISTALMGGQDYNFNFH
ncbi:MAG: hypothetical protein HQK54_08635, partial [Oligoflexales bacterium]|nr:hypothetical protein [Oligoflexales bacterium]